MSFDETGTKNNIHNHTNLYIMQTTHIIFLTKNKKHFIFDQLLKITSTTSYPCEAGISTFQCPEILNLLLSSLTSTSNIIHSEFDIYNPIQLVLTIHSDNPLQFNRFKLQQTFAAAGIILYQVTTISTLLCIKNLFTNTEDKISARTVESFHICFLKFCPDYKIFMQHVSLHTFDQRKIALLAYMYYFPTLEKKWNKLRLSA